MKLIDKAAIVAEIERQLHYVNSWLEGYERVNGARSNVYFRMLGNRSVLESIKDFLYTIDSIETKEVDFEKEYDRAFANDPVFNKLVNRNAGICIARHFFELGLKAREGKE